MRIKHLLLIIATLALASCRQHKDIVYLQDLKPGHAAISADAYDNLEYKLRPGDMIYIDVQTLDKELSSLFKQGAANSSTGTAYASDASLYIMGYTVNTDGDVDLPIVGKIKIANKTIDEAKDEIAEKLKLYLKEASVFVKLLNNRVTVMGEVKVPGIYTNYSTRLTVFDALSRAGDINEFGDIRNILVIREINGQTETFRLNLSKTDIMNQKGYYLMPNDVIYVSPVKLKNFRSNVPAYSLALSSLTTLLVILQYMNK